MDSTYYFDARSLRDHVSEVQEERRVVQYLYETAVHARDTGDPLLWREYGHVLNDIEKLRRYFEKMIEVLDDAAFDVTRLAEEIGSTVQSGTEQIQSLNGEMML